MNKILEGQVSTSRPSPSATTRIVVGSALAVLMTLPSSPPSPSRLHTPPHSTAGGYGWRPAYQRRHAAGGADHRLPTRVGDLLSGTVHDPCMATSPSLGSQESMHACMHTRKPTQSHNDARARFTSTRCPPWELRHHHFAASPAPAAIHSAYRIQRPCEPLSTTSNDVAANTQLPYHPSAVFTRVC